MLMLMEYTAHEYVTRALRELNYEILLTQIS